MFFETPLQVLDEASREVTGRYFVTRGNELVLERAVMPAMLTTNAQVIRQDCLCYLMERHALRS